MLEYRQTYALSGAAETYGVTLPADLVAARLAQDKPAELAAWARFSRPLMEALRVPFDTAATAYMGGINGHCPRCAPSGWCVTFSQKGGPRQPCRSGHRLMAGSSSGRSGSLTWAVSSAPSVCCPAPQEVRLAFNLTGSRLRSASAV
jgi:hypothetical protein